jgi:tetrapyrrole methylase family protein/MazG family protein
MRNLQVGEKVKEEMLELKEEIDSMDADKTESEFGDLIFSIINAARLYKVNPDNALERTNQKFIYRFNYMEKKVKEMGKSLNQLSLEELEEIWQEAKLTENC